MTDPEARKLALAAELDAIVARRSRGEITPEEAEALSDAAMRNAKADAVAWVRTTLGGREHPFRRRLKAVIVLAVAAAIALAVWRLA